MGFPGKLCLPHLWKRIPGLGAPGMEGGVPGWALRSLQREPARDFGISPTGTAGNPHLQHELIQKPIPAPEIAGSGAGASPALPGLAEFQVPALLG